MYIQIEQRLLALPIGRGQCKFRLSGLGLFDCSLIVFSSVKVYLFEKKIQILPLSVHFFLQIIQKAGSYFIILRSFR